MLPNGLRVETWNDKAWVGLVPFRMHVRTRRGPYLPWISHFPETNLRTYVRGPNGEVGVWFFSLEASRLPAVVIGRVGYGVWYHWARMKIQHAGDETHYQSQRILSAGQGTFTAHIRHGESVHSDDVTPFEHYLTARWSLFGLRRNRLTFARARHQRWPLRRAEAISWNTTLLELAGLSQPAHQPIVLSSHGVTVDIGGRTFISSRIQRPGLWPFAPDRPSRRRAP